MLNPQLVDYVKQQLQLGVSREAIRSTLLQAGWAEADVSEAITGAVPAAPRAQTQPTTPFVTRDIFESKSEPIFEPKAAAKSGGVFEVKDTVVLPKKEEPKPEPLARPAVLEPVKISVSGQGRSLRKILLPVVFVVLIVALGGAAAFLYLTNTNLTKQIATLSDNKSNLESTVSALNQNISRLQSEIATLKAENENIDSELALFVTPLPPASPTETAVSAKGTLGGGGKASYWIQTVRRIVFTVKNSKDTNVDAALKPLLGGTVDVSGTHLQGSRDITVTAVNGQPVSPQKAATTTVP